MTKEEMIKDMGIGGYTENLYPILERYAKQVAIDFANWTLESDCQYTATDEDQWTHGETRENVTTEELYAEFIKQYNQ